MRPATAAARRGPGWVTLVLLLLLLVVAVPAGAARGSRVGPAATPPFDPPATWTTLCDTRRGAGSRLAAGVNCRWLRLDGVFRRYLVVVPTAVAQDRTRGWPLVMMLHGHGGSGERMTSITDWVSVGRSAGVITVFPTSWRYRFSNGNVGTRWNTYQMEGNLDPEAPRMDGYPDDSPYPARDTEFLRRIVEDVNGSILVNPRRIHVTGSSNGGQFMARVAVELSDLVASASCSGYCDAPPEATWPDMTRAVPMLYALGTQDDSVLRRLADAMDPDPTSIPLDWSDSGPMVTPLASGYLDAWRLKNAPTEVTERATTTTISWRTPRPKGMPRAEYRLVLLLGAHHLYANARNNPAGNSTAWISWRFFRSHPMP